jgi:GTPase SAR1 family protein
LDNPKTAKTDLLLKVILVGDSSVGKSALMHRITQNEFI